MTRALALALSLVLIPAIAHAADVSFELINESSSDVVGFYASPVGVSTWEENMVVSAIAPDTTATATFDDPRDLCVYDLKIEFADLEPVVEAAIDLCEIESYTVEDAD